MQPESLPDVLLRSFAASIHLTRDDVDYLLSLLMDARAEERSGCAAIARDQEFFPDTKSGTRQQWVKDEIVRKIQERGAITKQPE